MKECNTFRGESPSSIPRMTASFLVLICALDMSDYTHTSSGTYVQYKNSAYTYMYVHTAHSYVAIVRLRNPRIARKVRIKVQVFVKKNNQIIIAYLSWIKASLNIITFFKNIFWRLPLYFDPYIDLLLRLLPHISLIALRSKLTDGTLCPWQLFHPRNHHHHRITKTWPKKKKRFGNSVHPTN